MWSVGLECGEGLDGDVGGYRWLQAWRGESRIRGGKIGLHLHGAIHLAFMTRQTSLENVAMFDMHRAVIDIVPVDKEMRRISAVSRSRLALGVVGLGNSRV